MVLALDVYYYDTYANAVGITFNWHDDLPKEVFVEIINNVEEYIPGEFYKRELPCILKVIAKLNLAELEAIIIDGYVFIDNEKKFGLGGYLWESLNKKVPVIGVAKTSYMGNKDTIVELLRGKSKNPLYISSIGVELNKTVELIKSMQGEYRIPTLLKELDKLTKQI